MKSHSFDLVHTHSSIRPRHTRMRRIEWLIAIAFLLTLFMASGAFLNHSTAADLEKPGTKSLQSAAPVPDPATPDAEAVKSLVLLKKLAASSMPAATDNSCEL